MARMLRGRANVGCGFVVKNESNKRSTILAIKASCEVA